VKLVRSRKETAVGQQKGVKAKRQLAVESKKAFPAIIPM
jgi:hypothetical protein